MTGKKEEKYLLLNRKASRKSEVAAAAFLPAHNHSISLLGKDISLKPCHNGVWVF